MPLMSKKMLIPMAALAIVGAGVYGAAKVSAATDTSGTNPQSSLVQKIADTFHLDKSKVQAVFDEDRTAREAERETQYEARLTQAVKDGQLTEAQKALVLAKHKELEAARKTAMDAAKSSDQATSQADRKAAMDKQKADIDAWAKANNIDAKWLMGGGMGGHGHGQGFGGPGGDMGTPPDGASPSASPSASSSN